MGGREGQVKNGQNSDGSGRLQVGEGGGGRRRKGSAEVGCAEL